MSQVDRNNRQRWVYDRNNGGAGAILAFGMPSWWLLHVWLKWSLWWIKKVLFPAGPLLFSRAGHWAVSSWCWEEKGSCYIKEGPLGQRKIFKTIS